MFIILREAKNLKRLRILTIVLVGVIFWAWELLEHFIFPAPTMADFLLELTMVTLLMSVLLYLLFNELIKAFGLLEESNRELFYLKNFHASILESSPHAIVAIDKNGLITSFNAQAGTISGYTATDAIGMDIFSLFNDKIEIRQTIEAARSGNGVETIKEIELMSNLGVRIPVLLLLKKIKNKGHNDEGFVMILEDLREKKRLEQRLIISEKMAAVSQMAAGLAHEIRNPLASISVNLKNLEDQYRSSKTAGYEKYFSMISSEVERLNRFLDKFVRFVVPKEIEINLAFCRLDEILNDALRECQRLLKDKRIYVGVNFPPAPMYVKCGREQLIQAFSNIIQNSVEAMPVSGKLTIEIQRDGGWGQVKICDTGCGISPENLRHIFDFYFTTKAGGLGVGLPFALLVIEQHGGRIEVESKINKGTCVMVWLPLNETESNGQ